ncbi:MAG TPA: MogA/MoaB family molybdenum cofactor biosynthesis protein [Candidatus Eisenbacteria bacterium]|jgi:molybdenum cofactor biosynthesis protein B
MKRARRPLHAAPARRALGCVVITVSDTRTAVDDASGDLLARLLEQAGHAVVGRAWVPDEVAAIRRAARGALARRGVDLVALTGGTGIAPRDRTPEALRPLVDRELPGFGELSRWLAFGQVGGAAWLSRTFAAVARGRLLVALPGSPDAVALTTKRLLIPELGHAARLLGRLKRGA